MDYDEVRHVLMDYGADPMVLEEYACVVDTARIVGDLVKLRGPYGIFALKKVYMEKDRLEYVHQVTEHVARSGNMMVPRLVKSRYGDAYVVHPSGLYYLTGWWSGRSPNVRKEEHLYACANLLGKWHHSAAGFYGGQSWYEDQGDASLVTKLESGLKALQNLENNVPQMDRLPPFVRLIRAAKDSLLERIDHVRTAIRQSALEELEAAARSEGLVCHGAFQKSNLVYNGETHQVRNYDHVHPGPPLYEFALFLHRYMPAYTWRIDVLNRLLEAYVAGSGGRFMDRERLHVLLSMPLRPLQLIDWYVGHVLNWDEADFVDALEWSLDLEEARNLAAFELVNDKDPLTPVQVPIDFMSGEKAQDEDISTAVMAVLAEPKQELVQYRPKAEDTLQTPARGKGRRKQKRKERPRSGVQTFGPTTPVDEQIDES